MSMSSATSGLRRGSRWGALGAAAALALSLLSTSAAATGAGDQSTQAQMGRVVMVSVDTSTAADHRTLAGLDLDGGVGGSTADQTSVILVGKSDQAKLRRSGLDWSVEVADLEQRNRQARQREQARMLALPGDAGALPPQALSEGRTLPKAASAMPSGRVSYRTMVQINNELRYLARTYPDTVKLFALPHRSLNGAKIYGIEITHDVDTDAGKPVFLTTGVTHAREWPTEEYAMEFAWHLVLGDGSDPRVTGLLDQTRVIVVPVVNVDGFNISRSLIQEYKRKNCRIEPGERPAPGECADPANEDAGVDLNRNQGAYWGDIGASPNPTSGTYRGEAPFSEPAIKNMRYLLTHNPVSIYNANHTYGEYVLRGPSNANEPTPPDEDQWAALAQAMAAENGYTPGPPFEVLYSTSGTSEETGWTATSTFSFEFEHGSEGFHPPYETVAAEWPENRDAYMVALEAAADPATHSVIDVAAPAGADLQLRKRFTMYTAPVLQPDGSRGNVIPLPMRVKIATTVPEDGQLDWHVQPSLRPSQARTAYIAESYTLSCVRPNGKAGRTETVTVARGEEVSVDLGNCAGR